MVLNQITPRHGVAKTETK